MPDVWIVWSPATEEERSANPPDPISPVVAALKRAILSDGNGAGVSSESRINRVELLTPTVVQSNWRSRDGLICPLTLDLPDRLSFTGRQIYHACRDLTTLRHTVTQWHYTAGDGDLWLPIAWTTRGPLYGEAIGVQKAERMGKEGAEDGERRTGSGRKSFEPSMLNFIPHPPIQETENRERRAETPLPILYPPSPIPSSSSTSTPPPYCQPIHLPDRQRQPLYQLAYRLLRSLAAPPAVYLMQFGLQEDGIQFDRLLPFPAEPAIASLGVQTPDLFTCHWRCLVGKPIHDLVI
jgi:hypothetical protein